MGGLRRHATHVARVLRGAEGVGESRTGSQGRRVAVRGVAGSRRRNASRRQAGRRRDEALAGRHA
eukprot:scaffold17835_cov58-Phaeocystis_antarctica.AAC.4